MPRDRTKLVAAVGGALAVVGVLWYAGPSIVGAHLDSHGIPHHVIFGADSELYRDEARFAPWSTHVLEGPASFGFMWFVQLAGRSLRVVVALQTAIWLAAWWWCARCIGTVVERRSARAAAWILVGGLALSAPLLEWTAAYATEALSLSLTAAAFGTAVRVMHDPSSRHVALLAALVVAAAWVRDTNAIVGVLLACGVIVAVVLRRRRRRVLAMFAVVVLAAGVVDLALAEPARRWYHPMVETAAIRLQGDATAGPYLRHHGFPQTAVVRALADPLVYVDRAGAVYAVPAYAALRRWSLHDGRRVYRNFALTHPKWVLAKPIASRNEILVPDVSAYPRGPLAGYGVHVPWVSRAIASVVFVGWLPLLAVELVACIGLFALACRRTRRRREARRWIVVAMIAGAVWFVHALIAFHGDALEVDRHELTAALTLRLVWWTALVAAIDSWPVTRRSAPDRS